MPSLGDFWKTVKTEGEIFKTGFQTNSIVGFLPAVLSQENRGRASGFVQDFEQQSGKKRKFIYKYKQRKLESTVLDTATDGAPNYCTAGTTPTYLQDEKEVTKDVYHKFTILDTQVRDFTENFRQVLNDEIEGAKDALLTKLDKLGIAAFEAGKGNTSVGDQVPLTGQGFSSLATRTANLAFREAVKEEYRKLSYKGNLIMVGDGVIPSYYSVLSDGAPNSERGQNMQSGVMRDFWFYDDAMLDGEVAGTNNALIWQPGSIQMLQWFANEGDFRKIQDDRVDDTIVLQLKVNDSLTLNVKFDIYMRYEHCTDATMGTTVTLRKHYDFWNFPSDQFAVGDALNGTNGMQRWQMTAG